jgi:PEP-CTERM motif
MNRQQMTRHALRALALAASLAAPGGPAQAEVSINANIDFDTVVSGSTANAALGSLGTLMHFANPDTVLDVDAFGSYTGTFHWVDATSTYGDVLVAATADAVSGTNVLSNSLQPIMLVFNEPVRLASFSIQQDLSGFGNPQSNGTTLSFLDASGHEIGAASLSYTQFGQPGFTIASGAVPYDVSAVLLAGGTNYDNLYLATTVPEPNAIVLLLAGAGLLAGLRWRSRDRG